MYNELSKVIPTSILLLAGFILFGCNSQAAKSNPAPTSERKENVSQAKVSEAAANSEMNHVADVPKHTVITLTRTICYGECPAYKLKIYASGRVVFQGERYVRKKGRAVGSISQDRLRQLIAEFERVNYFSLKDSYSLANREDCPNFGSDAPSAITSVTMNGKTREVFHSHGCEGTDTVRRLYELENKIDELANAKQWID